MQWRNFARRCLWARYGWVPHWLRIACAKCKKSKCATRASLAAWGPGARLRAPVGSRGKASGGGPGGEAPEAPVYFNADTAFPTQTYILQIVKLRTLKQIKIRQYSTCRLHNTKIIILWYSNCLRRVWVKLLGLSPSHCLAHVMFICVFAHASVLQLLGCMRQIGENYSLAEGNGSVQMCRKKERIKNQPLQFL